MILHDQSITRSFSLKASNELKLDMLVVKAKAIKDFKNYLSSVVCADFQSFMDMGKFDFVKAYFSPIPEHLSGQDAQKACEDVYEAYENKRDKLNRMVKFKTQDGFDVVRYKRNGKNFKKGDINTFTPHMVETKLTKVLSYLARYYNNGLFDYIQGKLQDPSLKPSMRLLYTDVLSYHNRHGQRLIDIVMARRESIIKRITEHPIEFKSLSFRSVNRIQDPIIDWNKNKDSKYNVFINLGCILGGRLEIPTKHSLDFHGPIENYMKGMNTSYIIVFQGDTPVKLSLVVEKDISIAIGKTNYESVDVNVKNNLFTLSNGGQIDYDRRMFNDYARFCKRMDEKNKRKKELMRSGDKAVKKEESKRDARTHRRWTVRIKNMLKEKCSGLVEELKKAGKDHLVVEDLGQFAKSFAKTEEYDGFKYSRLVKLLNLSDLKNILKSICDKNDLQVTFIQSHYTSQTCSKCGFVHRGNRTTQEKFLCLECGFELNADTNAALNILNRLALDVLRRGLLEETLHGFKPRKVSKDDIRRSIEDAYSMVVPALKKAV